MSKKEDGNSKLGWKIGSAILIVLFGLVIGFIIWFFYIGSPKEIISVADQFKPKSEWKLTQNHVEPPRNFCVDVRCPSLGRSWTLPEKINRERFEQIAYIGKTKLTIANDCFEKDGDGNVIESCDASAIIDGYDVLLSYSGSIPQIVLAIEKE